MKATKIFATAALALLAGFGLASCDDACDYLDNDTDNPGFVDNYTESTEVSHPESLEGTTWVRAKGIKTNVYGEEVQGFVESLEFISEDRVVVKMSQPEMPASWDLGKVVWTDDSNTDNLPDYKYIYSELTGDLDILKTTVNDKGGVSETSIFKGMAVNGTKTVLVVSHFGDNPIQTYLVRN